MNKKTIAFLTRSLVDATGKNMWKGIVTGCKNDNKPLITFRGPVLNKGQGSIIYHLISDNVFDGVISWASSDVDQPTIDYYKKFVNTPLVCMTFKIEGHPVIITDCRTGIIELMNHLIEVHHFSKIAFIRGPETHIYAKERYEGYLEGLQNHGIEINQELISPCGGWAIADGAKAVDAFLAKGFKPGKDIEAIVAVGDNVAIGAQEQLIKKGFSIPHDIAVCGFNGTNDAAWSNPPITTVEMPFYGQGLKGYETLKATMNNQPVQDEFRYSTRLVLGQSCGCTSASVQRAFFSSSAETSTNPAKGGIFKKKIANTFLSDSEICEKFKSTDFQDKLKTKILQTVREDRYTNQYTNEFFAGFVNKFVDSFIKDCLSNEEKPLFTQTISIGLNKFISVSTEFTVWQDIVSELRNFITPFLTKSNFISKSDNLIQQARILINEVDCRTQKQMNLLESRNENNLRQISTDILSCSDVDGLMNIITKSIGKIGIDGVYVVLYDNCEYTEENHLIPETSRLILAVTNHERISLPEGGLTFETKDILPDSISNVDTFRIFEVESLHYQDQYLGYIVFESSKDNGVAFSTLRDQISCSLYSALLLKERNESRVIMEGTMQAMTEKADVVSNQAELISNNITTISQSMDNVATNIRDISGNISTVADTVVSANRMINDANSAIETLVESTEQITTAIYMINDIAEKTNVLALNAAIEAAHAGDAGRGFSVVAKEVKSLAAQTVSSTQAIQDLVERNNINTKQTEEVINATNAAIKTIANLSENIKNSITEQVSTSAEISNQLQTASTGAEQISDAIIEIAKLGERLAQ